MRHDDWKMITFSAPHGLEPRWLVVYRGELFRVLSVLTRTDAIVRPARWWERAGFAVGWALHGALARARSALGRLGRLVGLG